MVLAALKLALMPAAYSVAGGVLGSRVPAAFLSFLGSLPASASVYSLALVAGLSPRVLGPPAASNTPSALSPRTAPHPPARRLPRLSSLLPTPTLRILCSVEARGGLRIPPQVAPGLRR